MRVMLNMPNDSGAALLSLMPPHNLVTTTSHVSSHSEAGAHVRSRKGLFKILLLHQKCKEKTRRCLLLRLFVLRESERRRRRRC